MQAISVTFRLALKIGIINEIGLLNYIHLFLKYENYIYAI